MNSHWIEPLLYAAGSIVAGLYVFQTVWPRLRPLLFSEPTAEERAAELLKKHRQTRP